ncbi:ATP-binding protein [Culturomica massiliensis]|uniref:ATP-binding protein n=1 Tax=Culturomica massiliensis TaxID=1841857 RepID=UPI0008394E02|nr:ATP-binding protein [Culturomica massiliensis]
MKKTILLLILFHTIHARAYEGVPFFTNYPSSVYRANNQNFDVLCDSCGNVYIANFEGILHYDYCRWNILYMPGFSRVTHLYRSSQGTIWAGGYNVFGRINYDKRGCPVFKVIASDLDEPFIGELENITETEGHIYLKMTSGQIYTVQADSLLPLICHPSEKSNKNVPKNPEINQILSLPNKWQVQATVNHGLVVTDLTGQPLFSLNEKNGLCSNTVSRIATDMQGNLWGVTDNGVFRVSLPSVFSHYTPHEGLKGEVISLVRYKGTLYAGTLQGLYFLENNTFSPVKGITQACWELCISPQEKLYAATSDGVFLIRDPNKIHKTSQASAFSLAFTGNTQFLIGSIDGIYWQNSINHPAKKISQVEKAIRLKVQNDGSILAKTIYGEIYVHSNKTSSFVRLPRKADEIMTAYTDRSGRHWRTDIRGKKLQVDSASIGNNRLNRYLKALQNHVIRVIYTEDERAAWLGGDFGLIRIDLHEIKSHALEKPSVFIREIRLNQDSVYRGGFFQEYVQKNNRMSEEIPRFENRFHNIRFSFATHAAGLGEPNQYRYQLNGYDTEWSLWNSLTAKEYTNLSPGTYTFRVQTRDMYGNESETKEFRFTLLPPLYLKWYSLLFYLLALAGLLFLVFKWRMHKLLKEKEKLENIVNQRTLLLMKQKDEIEEKSMKLEETLTELGKAQEGLVRQEKMATVGKLTKGLIDRILNPLNYINNFSHLTAGLLQDLYKNLEDMGEYLKEDIYADSLDILNMMEKNLGKIEEHGSNTTRILKAMEEILKDRNKQMEKMDLVALYRKNIELLGKYYEKETERIPISIDIRLPGEPLFIDGNAELLSKTLMSLLNNGMYAIIKKYNKKEYSPEIRLELKSENGQAVTRIYDTGIGIEPSILDKIFDPFFTTKTTGEAAGTGLYLSKEIILNHRGQISVRSEKNEYTEFTITLPLRKEQ